MSDADVAAEQHAIDMRVTAFLDDLGRLKAIMTTGQHLASVEIGVVENALVRVRDGLRDGLPCAAGAQRPVARGLDRLEPAVRAVLLAHGRVERDRHIAQLRALAADQRDLLDAVRNTVDPDVDRRRFRATLTAAAEYDLQTEVRALLDRSVYRIEELLRENRRGEELRDSAFAELVESKTTEIDRVAALGTERVEATIVRARSEFDELCRQVSDLQTTVQSIAEQEYLGRLTHEHRIAEGREDKRYHRYLRSATFWAALALVPLVLLFFSPLPSVLAWLAHIGPATVMTSISTVYLRMSLRHRKEAIKLRDQRLGLGVVVLAASEGFTVEQRGVLRIHLDKPLKEPPGPDDADTIAYPPVGWAVRVPSEVPRVAPEPDGAR